MLQASLIESLSAPSSARDAVLTRPEDLVPYSFDGTAALEEAAVGGRVSADDGAGRRLREAGGGERHADRHARLGHRPERRQRAEPGCVVLCLTQMDRSWRSIRATSRSRAAGRDHAADRRSRRRGTGCSIRRIPGSHAISTIGGNVAENSGGLRGLKYGVTRDYVMGLEVVLANGGDRVARQQVRQGRRGLLAEGSVHRLRGHARHHHRGAAQARAAAGGAADDAGALRPIEAAAETVSAIIAAKIIPCTLEFLDRMTTGCVEDYAHVGLPTDARPCCSWKPTATRRPSPTKRRRWRRSPARTAPAKSAPRATTPKALQLAVGAPQRVLGARPRRPTTILEDVTVPRSELATMVGFIAETARGTTC